MIRAALVYTVAFGLAGCASQQAPRTGTSPDTLLTAASLKPSRRLRVMTFNIQSARHGLDAVAEVIRSERPDIVALQEVDNGTRRASGLNQAEELAKRAGYPHFRHVRATTLFGGEYGVAVLSKHPLVSVRSYELPTTPLIEPRTVAHAVVALAPGRELSVYVTHLTNATVRSELRALQAQYIARLASSDPRPRIITGDLNDAPDSPALLLLSSRYPCAFDRAGVGDPDTYPLPSFLPDLRLDYLLASPELRPLRSWVVHKLASDHFPLVADFALRESTPAVVASGADSR